MENWEALDIKRDGSLSLRAGLIEGGGHSCGVVVAAAYLCIVWRLWFPAAAVLLPGSDRFLERLNPGPKRGQQRNVVQLVTIAHGRVQIMSRCKMYLAG